MLIKKGNIIWGDGWAKGQGWKQRLSWKDLIKFFAQPFTFQSLIYFSF